MTRHRKSKELSFTQSLLEGVVIDALLLMGASTIMDGGIIAAITFFVAIAHLSASVYLGLRHKKKVSDSDPYFIRFGCLPLIFVALGGRIVVSAIQHFLN